MSSTGETLPWDEKDDYETEKQYIKMTIKEIQDQIVEDFSMFDDWMDRYAMLIEMGKECPLIDEQYRNDQYLINGKRRPWA